MKNPLYCYLFTRKDLKPEQICVQTAHAAMEAGIYFGKKTAEPYYFAWLEVPDESALKCLMWTLEQTDIRYRAFVEPDLNFQYTSICTEPITKQQGKIFSSYPSFRFRKKK